MILLRKTLLSAFLLAPAIAYSHGGGLDRNGGHNDRKNGGYHCHREPCISQHALSNSATLEAKKENRSFSYGYDRSDWKHWSDFDNDCMNTRHETLKAQADGPIKTSPDGCFVCGPISKKENEEEVLAGARRNSARFMVGDWRTVTHWFEE